MKSAFFIKDITKAKTDHSAYPFNLKTMRARRKVNSALGCAYVSAVAKAIAEDHGTTISERDADGTAWSFYAYAANRAHEIYTKRKLKRALLARGFRPASEFVKEGDKVTFLNNDKQFDGRVVFGNCGLGIMPTKNRTRYIPLISCEIWAKPKIERQSRGGV
jgi:hypothetical protein